MLARLPGVALELEPALGLVLGLLGVEEGFERHLRVGDEAPPLRQQEAGVGPQSAVLGLKRLLQLEVDVLGHPGDLDAAPELKLAPLAAGLRLAQRLLQPGRLRVEVADRLAELLDHRLGLEVDFAAPADLGFDLLLALRDPLGESLDLGLARVERGLGGLRVDLAGLVIDPQQVLDGLRGRRLDRRSEVWLLLGLLATGDERIDEGRDQNDDCECEYECHRPMVTRGSDATINLGRDLHLPRIAW